jgi:hypothetical protein
VQTDDDFLGLTTAGDRSSFVVVERLARLDGRLYGGSAIAVSIATAERRTGVPALWMTTQFVSTVELGAVVDVRTDVLAAGRRTNQVRVTATSETGDVVFASLGATGRHRPDGLTGVFERAPTVTPPDEAEPWKNPFTGIAKAAGLAHDELPLRRVGFSVVVDMRQPDVLDHPEPGPGRVCLWVRRRDGVPVTPAVASYLADMVPMSVAYALGVVAGGTSLDNTIRIGSFVDTPRPPATPRRGRLRPRRGERLERGRPPARHRQPDRRHAPLRPRRHPRAGPAHGGLLGARLAARSRTVVA